MKKAVSDRLLTPLELATKWGRSSSWLRRRVQRQQIPYVLVEGRLYFRESAVEGWLAAQSSVPQAPAQVPRRAPTARTLREELADYGLTEEDVAGDRL